MTSSIRRRLEDFFNSWPGRLISAAALPVWVLLVASSQHGGPTLTAATTPILVGLVAGGGLVGAGFGLRAVLHPAPAKFPARTAIGSTPHSSLQSPMQTFLAVLAAGCFFASIYQVVFDFDLYRRLLSRTPWPPINSLSAWDVLLTLLGLYFLLSLAGLGFNRRG